MTKMTSAHTPTEVVAHAAGKLFVAGEYAVVEPGQPAILVAVNRFVSVHLKETFGQGSIHSEQYGKQPVAWYRRDGKLCVDLGDRPYDYVLAILETVEELVRLRGKELQFYDLSIKSELDDTSGRKFGLGSSAAVTAATARALNEFYQLNLSDLDLIKLCLVATVRINKLASGGDLAASILGGWVLYTSPDREWIHQTYEKEGLLSLMEQEWQYFCAERLTSPKSVSLYVGWTGKPASTMRLVDEMKNQSTEHASLYQQFLSDSKTNTLALAEAIRQDDCEAILVHIRQARALLQFLENFTEITIETEILAKLCAAAETIGQAAKSSGAGGGDCGIVLADSQADMSGLFTEWELNDIRRLSLDVYG